MRESWRRRNQKAGTLAGDSTPQKAFQPQVDSFEAPLLDPEAVSHDDRLLPRDTISVNLRHTVKPPKTPSSEPIWNVTSLTISPAQSVSPYAALSGNDGLDPFNTLRIDVEDQKLLYHCKSDFKIERLD